MRFENDNFSKQEKRTVIPALEDMNVITVPAQLKTIQEQAFAGINSQAVIISEGCESIGQKAFENCMNLIYILIPVETDVAEDAFEGCGRVVVDRK